MPSAYLQPEDLAAYGLPDSTSAGAVTQASVLVDMYLRRPEGLIWTPDATGNPCFMTAASPGPTITATGTISAGANVIVPATGPLAMLQVGDVLILDRARADVMEAVTVSAIVPGISVGLRSVTNAHSPSALLEGGMVIQEQRFLPDNRPLTSLGRTPVARVVSGTGRYGYGRQGDAGASSINDFNLLAALSQFGGPPVWEIFDPASTDVDPNTGQLWIPAGVMLAYYTEVKVRYLAGYSAASLPSAVKLATAMLVRTLASAPNLGAIKSYKAGDTAIERFSDTMISGDIRSMLTKYRARTFA